MSKIEDRLRKLLALAEGGVGGEKVNAQRMLESMLEKHDMSVEDISDDLIETYWFKYKGKLEKRLLYQIINSVSKNADLWKHRKRRETTGADVTKTQMLEIELKFECYKKALNDDIDSLFTAFIHTNKIYPLSDEVDDEDESELQTPEEKARLFKIAQMMQGMDKVEILKSIESAI